MPYDLRGKNVLVTGGSRFVSFLVLLGPNPQFAGKYPNPLKRLSCGGYIANLVLIFEMSYFVVVRVYHYSERDKLIQ